MKTLLMFVFLVSVFFASTSFAGLLFTYHQLALKDLDSMTQLVQQKVKESKRASDGKVVPLKEAYQAVMSRPNDDGLIEKVIDPVRNELEDLNQKERIIEALTQEAINALTNTKNFKPDVQVTYWIFLENTISDLKQNLGKEGVLKSAFEHKMLQKIVDAKLEITDKARQERTLRMMKSNISPSTVAASVIRNFDQKEAKKEEKK
ncbi:MAG: hypothetical protein ACK5WZ_11970 [Pseudobdellovibrionaceae bacterium]